MKIKVRVIQDFPPVFTKFYGYDGSVHLRIKHFVNFE
jgi:hypothetical protein